MLARSPVDAVIRAGAGLARCALWATLVTLAACGGGGGGSSGTGGGGGGSTTYTLGGTVSGLGNNSGLILANGGTTLSVAAGASTFAFPTALAAGTSYSVTVQASPTGLNCTVASASGTINANVTNVAVTCSPMTFSLGGSITGLGNNSGLILANGGTTLSVAAGATTFAFPTALAAGTSYSVTVQTSPTGLNCTVASGSGTINANVTNVAVTCSPMTFALGGSITGLGSASGLVLTNEGADATPVAANATTFTMKTPVAFGTAYNVAVQTNPADLNCTVSAGSGTMPASAVTSVQVACAAGTESVVHSFGGTGDGSGPTYGGLIQASDGNLYGVTTGGGAHGAGTVFKITPAGVESVLYSFAGGSTDGAAPYGSLVQASDGNLYGTTSAGGANNAGTVFMITTAGAESVVHSFGAGSDGATPYGGLIQGTDGNLYGTTNTGGTAGYGTVYQITTAGAETVLHSFAATNDGQFPYGPLVQASDGNLYGTTQLGGAHTLGTIFKMTTSGTPYAVLYSFAGTSDGSEPYGGLVQGSDGKLYGTTTTGGAHGLGTVFSTTTAANTETVLFSFGATGDAAKPYGNLIQANDGNLYGLAQQGGANSLGAVFRISTTGTEAVIYSFGTTADGTAPQGGLLQASNGDLYGTTPAGGANSAGTVFAIN